jgi:hypothetical protein
MTKKYRITLNNGNDADPIDLYTGQIWRDAELASYRKIAKIGGRKGKSLVIHFTFGEDQLAECDVDDFIMWIIDNGARPLVLSYEAIEDGNS